MYQPNFTWDGTYYIGNITFANETADLAYIQFILGVSGDPALLYITQDSWQRPVKIYVNTTVRWESLFTSLTMYKLVRQPAQLVEDILIKQSFVTELSGVFIQVSQSKEETQDHLCTTMALEEMVDHG